MTWSWFFIALLTPIFHALANIFDARLSYKVFPKISTLIFYTTFFNVFVLPFVFLFEIPALPPVHLLPFFFLIALCEIFYLYPYYRALQQDDTAIVASLFSLGKVFVPLLAFLFVHERLAPLQYIGFFLIIFSSAALTFRFRAFRFRSSFFFMLLCSFILACEAVIYKYVLDYLSWSTGFFWVSLFSAFLMLFPLLLPHFRRAVFFHFSQTRRIFPIFFLDEFCTFVGTLAFVFSVSHVPVTVAQGIEAIQPFFVLLFTVLLAPFFSRTLRTHACTQDFVKKVICFTIMGIGFLFTV